MIPIYIPNPKTSDTQSMVHRLPQGTAIVGEYESLLGRVCIDYEGNIYNSTSMRRFVERVHHAWNRHATRYPTVARAWVHEYDLFMVAEYDPERRLVVADQLDLPRLAEWLGISGDVPQEELVL